MVKLDCGWIEKRIENTNLLFQQLNLPILTNSMEYMPVFMSLAHSPMSTLYALDREANFYCIPCAKNDNHFRTLLLPPCQDTQICHLFPSRTIICFCYWWKFISENITLCKHESVLLSLIIFVLLFIESLKYLIELSSFPVLIHKLSRLTVDLSFMCIN